MCPLRSRHVRGWHHAVEVANAKAVSIVPRGAVVSLVCASDQKHNSWGHGQLFWRVQPVLNATGVTMVAACREMPKHRGGIALTKPLNIPVDRKRASDDYVCYCYLLPRVHCQRRQGNGGNALRTVSLFGCLYSKPMWSKRAN